MKKIKIILFIAFAVATCVLMLTLKEKIQCPILVGFLIPIGIIQFIPFKGIPQVFTGVVLFGLGIGIATGVTAGFDPVVRVTIGMAISIFSALYGTVALFVFRKTFSDEDNIVGQVFLTVALLGCLAINVYHISKKLYVNDVLIVTQENPEWIVLSKSLSDKYKSTLSAEYNVFSRFQEIDIDQTGIMSRKTTEPIDDYIYGFTISQKSGSELLSFIIQDTLGAIQEEVTFRLEKNIGMIEYKQWYRPENQRIRDSLESITRFNQLIAKAPEIAKR